MPNLKEMKLSSFAMFLFAPVLMYVHPDFGGASGFWHGLSHPFSGLDHMIAMIAVGIWAVQAGGKATWLIPLSFVLMMIAGGVLGMYGITIPFVEKGIVMSVLILGLLIVASARLPLVVGMLVAGVFALFHGHAHGSEIPAAASGFAFSSGFTLATILLHSAGIGIGITSAKLSKERLLRYAGVPIVLAGIAMLVF